MFEIQMCFTKHYICDVIVPWRIAGEDWWHVLQAPVTESREYVLYVHAFNKRN